MTVIVRIAEGTWNWQLARATFRTIRRNLAWAFGYNLAAIPPAATGFLNPSSPPPP